jgi:hypothetical protein
LNTEKIVARAATLLTIGLLAACTSGMTQPPAIESAALKPHHAGSWMSPGAAKQKNLLYVSDSGNYNVYVFAYPSGTLVGTLTGFDWPQGECVDKAGDVFITNARGHNILEYAHAGTSPIATLTDSYGYPFACAIDPKTGNLAVTDEVGDGNSQPAGDVLIYKNASGTPTQYQDGGYPAIYYYDFCGYDDKSNLYVDGNTQGYKAHFAFAELPKGSSSFTNITLSTYINYPGGIQWDGEHLAVGDQLSTPPTVYQIAFNGSKNTEVGATQLAGTSDVAQFWIPNLLNGQRKRGNIVAVDYGDPRDVGIWKFPKGGSAKQTLTGFDEPFGAAVSELK